MIIKGGENEQVFCWVGDSTDCFSSTLCLDEPKKIIDSLRQKDIGEMSAFWV